MFLDIIIFVNGHSLESSSPPPLLPPQKKDKNNIFLDIIIFVNDHIFGYILHIFYKNFTIKLIVVKFHAEVVCYCLCL